MLDIRHEAGLPGSEWQPPTRIADLRQRFRPQREWAEGRGLLLITAHFFTGTGAGAWFFAALLDFSPGLPLGFTLVAMGAVLHLFFLGRPERFWRMAQGFRTSWISRGLLGMTLFLVIAPAYLLLALLAAQNTAIGATLLALSLLGALWIVIYKGFVWASSKGIPLWNTPLIPVLYIAYALRGGASALVIMAALATLTSPMELLEPIKLWLAVSTCLLVVVYIEVMRGSGTTALRSVEIMLFGRVAVSFYVGAVLLGLLLPISIGGLTYFTGLSPALLALLGLFSLLGDLSIIYCIAKAGLYRPLPV
jgi:formate-dependent nitrite reductase membrane component NrfD